MSVIENFNIEEENGVVVKGKEQAEIETSDFLSDKEKMVDFKILSKEEFLASYSYLTEAEYDNTAREVAVEIANFYDEFTDEPEKPTVDLILEEMEENGVPATLVEYVEDIADWLDSFEDELSKKEIQAAEDLIDLLDKEPETVRLSEFEVYKDLTDINAFMEQLNNDAYIASLDTPEGTRAFLDARVESGRLEVVYTGNEDCGDLLAKRAIKLETGTPEEIYEKIAEVINEYEGEEVVPSSLIKFTLANGNGQYIECADRNEAETMLDSLNNNEHGERYELLTERNPDVKVTLAYEQPVNYFALSANERTKHTAEEFGITDKLEALTSDLMQIKGVVNVEYDLDGFWDDMKHVIFLPKYDIPVEAENYFEQRSEMLESVLETAKKHGLTRTEDSIEDYGEHFYIVTRHDESWLAKEDKPKEKPKKKAGIERD